MRKRPAPPQAAQDDITSERGLRHLFAQERVPPEWHVALLKLIRRQANAAVAKHGGGKPEAIAQAVTAYMGVDPNATGLGLTLAAASEVYGYPFDYALPTARLFVKLRGRFFSRAANGGNPEQIPSRLAELIIPILERLSKRVPPGTAATLANDPLLFDDALEAFLAHNPDLDLPWQSRSGMTITLEDCLENILLAATCRIRGPLLVHFLQQEGLKWLFVLRQLAEDDLLDQPTLWELVMRPGSVPSPNLFRVELERWRDEGFYGSFLEFLDAPPSTHTVEMLSEDLERLCARVLVPSDPPPRRRR